MVTSKPKLLHIISDEKFPDAAYRQFEVAAPGSSTYLLPDTKNEIKYLKEINPLRVSKYSFLSKKFIKSLDQYDAVILHSMSDFALEIIGRSNLDVLFVWIGMGSDYCDFIYGDVSEILEPKTTAIVKEYMPNTTNQKIKRALKKLVYPHSMKKRELIERIAIFSPVLHSEYKVIKQSLKVFPAEYVKWNYGTQTDLFDSDAEAGWAKGNNIIVGNSASPNNNHIEIFHIINKIGLPLDTKIIVPLSYGVPDYRERIIQEGNAIFGDNFQPITEFLNLKEYVALLAKCPVMIMNHKRQQGAGNIGIALFLGTKIFMNPESLLLSEYLAQKLAVFKIDDLKGELESGIKGLSQEAATFNREYLKREKGFDTHVEQTQAFIKRIVELRCSRIKPF
ncbi:TDP-N-acetylfucosamine:lipid II N-acetylfucosaminyltransferase [Paraglaciecola sp. MB-3u-78]|jgi:dTDP-N-acetylfucosamine:lipid II N-acetylfucosaminyltransferase|uniref:TDP-N-acetylfucosamine:lipid II N-acetylfucosaminyltransferase n=1 Tax=Paraglaciecola sp. MB-3u-78 TaxID=2058332 RepID=UPI000C341B5E|nr:TDP-N-acetylfucosamine:lipid II N-acetylfucosaminyltransferase [Paraglaciecola sp. MB-3u-78]PKG93138.1 hypothetical protein CXF95_26475 [Paraglaciecola sp. MB-3u-78]